MKVVILCGGRGTRLSEETMLKPKPMVEVGGKPILWHIMRHYSFYGYNEFILALGYKGNVIRDYFLNFNAYNGDLTIRLDQPWGTNAYNAKPETKWQVTMVDTGLNTQTGGRLKRLQTLLGRDPFMLTYGDGLSNINLDELLRFHHNSHQENLATVTAVLSKSKFGEVEFDKLGTVTSFEEKSNGSWINGGYMVMEPEVFDYIEGDNDILETGLLSILTRSNMLGAYSHSKFWQCVDTLKELEYVNKLWDEGNPPWVW